MPKSPKIKYTYSGELEDVKRALRQFSTNEILKRINVEATALLRQGPENAFPAAKYVSYTIYKSPSLLPQKQDSIITAWGLINLAYHAILYSNDYRGKAIDHDEEFFMLYDAVEGMRQRDESIALDKNDDPVKSILYIWGFAGEQFKMEQIGKVFDSAGRELYILFESSKNTPDYMIDIVDIVMQETGYSWEKIICALFLGWFFFTNRSDYQSQLMHFNNDDILTEYEYLQIIKKYTCTYETVRNSSLKRQVFYTKPYIETQRRELVSISPYLNFFLYEHCIFWIIRDHYQKQGDQKFTSYFGQYFEAYFKELLENCLNQNEFERIPEDKTQRADWKLTIGGYRFLVEQKSTIMRLAAKQQETDIASIEDFAIKTVIKALRQLQKTESEFNDGKYIKVILLYDDYMKSEALEQIFSMPECDVETDDYYWLVSIEELELLLPLWKNNRNLFETIITDKINRELAHSINGRGLSQLLQENGITKNEYLAQEKILKYKFFAQEQSRMVLGGEKS